MVQEIYIIDDNTDLIKMLKELFQKEKQYKFLRGVICAIVMKIH